MGLHMLLSCVGGVWPPAMADSVCCAESSSCLSWCCTPAGCSSIGGEPVCKKARPLMAGLLRPAASTRFMYGSSIHH